MDDNKSVSIYTATSYIKNKQNNFISAICLLQQDIPSSPIVEVTTEMNYTNQRLELYCIQLCLDRYKEFLNIVIYSKSLYAVSAINQWSIKWKDKGWANISSDNSNIAVIKQITEQITELRSQGKIITIIHVSKADNNIFSKNAQISATSKVREILDII